MSFERLGDLMSQKDFDTTTDLLGFFEKVRGVVRKQTGVELESVRYKNEIVTVSTATATEASEIRLRHIQIENALRQQTKLVVKRVAVAVA